MSGMTFLLGMLSPRTNVKGMIAGYIGGMIPLTCSLIGMFFIPRHKSFYNSTERVLTIFLPDQLSPSKGSYTRVFKNENIFAS